MKNLLAVTLLVSLSSAAVTASSQSTTAWHQGRFHVDTAGVLGRSSIVLEHPNVEAGQAMPLGNGRLGVAVWSADGLTAQLNRADTLPERYSPGQIVLPGLSTLMKAQDYSGRLDLYNGEFREQGGGMTATAYVQPDADVLVVDVTGAKPDETQTAQLKLWEPRTSNIAAEGKIGFLFQSWLDNKNPESSGRPFGSLSAITVQGRNVSAKVTNQLTVTISFKPNVDGHFRVLIASPHYDGGQEPLALVRAAFADPEPAAHKLWWNNYWKRAAVIKITSADGSGEYMENLRNIYLFVAAAEKGVEYPGSQAGVADMVSSARDGHRWDSSAFWHWNLRMMVAANLSAGLPELNAPYFNLYRENLANIEDWTKQHMKGYPGSCIPETMRFNGRGIEYESTWKPISVGRNCDAAFKPYYNARTLSTGAEVSFWIWQQYLATNDRDFLANNYPLMVSSARFLLAYQKLGRDGLLHTSPSNAHETQWDVTDPTTDIAATLVLYPIVIEAAKALGRDLDLIQQLQSALPKIPAFPRTQASGSRTLLSPSDDGDGQDVIAESYLPDAANQNVENIGLEPVWPYGLIGDTSPLFNLAKRTYEHRLFSAVADWSFDPIQSARLGLGNEVKSTLVKITERSQHSPNGLANWDAEYGEFYVEQVGVVAAALQEALVQDYDGLIRIAPAVPSDWNFDGCVFVRGKTKIDVQVKNGIVTTAVIEAGTTQLYKVRNPWAGQLMKVVSGTDHEEIVKATSDSIVTFHGEAGQSYLVQRQNPLDTNQRFEPISGMPARSVKKLGEAKIGVSSRIQ